MANQQDPTRTYNLGFNKFMDLTPEEFKAKYLATKVPTSTTKPNPSLSQVFPPLSTGEPKVQLPQLKIKVNVDHAGLFPLPVL